MQKPETINVTYSDEFLIVVDKPGGLLTTPAHGELSLVDLLNQRFIGRFQLFVVHRLDRGTSGLLVFARTPVVARHLSLQFAKHSIEREYVAIVKGHVPERRGFIEIDVNGKKAKTYYEVLERLDSTTIMRLRLSTGRRNQIRYHVSALGFPVVGDERIGGELARISGWQQARIALHARLLSFIHPVLKSKLHFESQLPVAMQEFIDIEKRRVLS
jgi:23S rRNA pseudouridine1911/1915/1917 synthase